MPDAIMNVFLEVLKSHGFNAFLVVLTLSIVLYFTKYIIGRVEQIHQAEVERLTQQNERLFRLLELKNRGAEEGGRDE